MPKPEDMFYRAEDFPGDKMPADMTLDELLSALREVMGEAMTHHFNSDTAFFIWDELDNRMCGRDDQPSEWRPYYS